MKQKGIIQIPLLITIIIAVVLVSGVTTGIVLHKQNKIEITEILKLIENQKGAINTIKERLKIEAKPEKSSESIIIEESVEIEKEPSESFSKIKTELVSELESLSETPKEENSYDDIKEPENRDGWVNIEEPYSCCDGDRSCTCQLQEYHEYLDSGYKIIEARINQFNCTSCLEYETCKNDEEELFYLKGEGYIYRSTGECRKICENTDKDCGVMVDGKRMNCINCNDLDGWIELYKGKCDIGNIYILELKEYQDYQCWRTLLDDFICKYDITKCAISFSNKGEDIIHYSEEDNSCSSYLSEMDNCLNSE